MSYAIKEIFYSIQGEGAHAGRPAVFCRFAGCNLWSGLETDRATAMCQFCDTDFVGTDGTNGGEYASAYEVAEQVVSLWPRGDCHQSSPYVVCTGGEPLLQLDEELIDALHYQGFEVGVETNGTIIAPQGLDWICVSPKAHTPFVLDEGNEIKLVYPQVDANPADYEQYHFEHFYLQPMDGPDRDENINAVIRYCLDHPQWRLSLQLHKIIGVH